MRAPTVPNYPPHASSLPEVMRLFPSRGTHSRKRTRHPGPRLTRTRGQTSTQVGWLHASLNGTFLLRAPANLEIWNKNESRPGRVALLVGALSCKPKQRCGFGPRSGGVQEAALCWQQHQTCSGPRVTGVGAHPAPGRREWEGHLRTQLHRLSGNGCID